MDPYTDRLECRKYLCKIDELYNTNEKLFNSFNTNNTQINIHKLEDQFKNNKYFDNFHKFLLEYYKKSQYISVNTVVEMYDEHISNIIHLSKKYEIILVTTRYTTKSNFWLTMYIYGKLRNTGVNMKYAFQELDNFAPNSCYGSCWDEYKFLSEHSNGKKFLCLLVDDVVYSGTQIVEHIKGLCNKIRKIEPNIYIYLCIVGSTMGGLNNIIRSVDDASHILGLNNIIVINYAYQITGKILKLDKSMIDKIFSNEEEIPHKYIMNFIKNDSFYLTYDIVKIDNIKKITNIKMKSKLLDFMIDNMSISHTTAYLEYKYPDNMSTVQNLCFTKIDNGIELLFDKMTSEMQSNIISQYNTMFMLHGVNIDQILKPNEINKVASVITEYEYMRNALLFLEKLNYFFGDINKLMNDEIFQSAIEQIFMEYIKVGNINKKEFYRIYENYGTGYLIHDRDIDDIFIMYTNCGLSPNLIFDILTHIKHSNINNYSDYMMTNVFPEKIIVLFDKCNNTFDTKLNSNLICNAQECLKPFYKKLVYTYRNIPITDLSILVETKTIIDVDDIDDFVGGEIYKTKYLKYKSKYLHMLKNN